MNTQRAYINGFVKRANEYGFSNDQAIALLKQAMGETPMAGKAKPPVKAPSKPRVPEAIKGNANDVANIPPPLKPMGPNEF